MTAPDKFVTTAPLPTPREREILVILIEECAEIQHRASKALRFGLTDVEPGQDDANIERLADEIGDLFAVVGMARMEGLLVEARFNAALDRKLGRLERYMQTEKEDV